MLTDTTCVTQQCGKGKEEVIVGEGKVTADLIEELTDALGEFHALKEVCSTLEGVVQQLLYRVTPQPQSTLTPCTSLSTKSSARLTSQISSMNIG